MILLRMLHLKMRNIDLNQPITEMALGAQLRCRRAQVE